jgi:hypothetical protein
MDYPASTEFYSSCFPDDSNPIKNISDKINSRPTSETTFKRHHLNQSGITLRSDGSVEIRTGREDLSTEDLGASIVLGSDGTLTIIAPSGLYYSGDDIRLPGPPSEVFEFDYGTYIMNPFWESSVSLIDTLTARNPITYRMEPNTTSLMVLLPGSDTPVAIPLNKIFQDEAITIPKDTSIIESILNAIS